MKKTKVVKNRELAAIDRAARELLIQKVVFKGLNQKAKVLLIEACEPAAKKGRPSKAKNVEPAIADPCACEAGENIDALNQEVLKKQLPLSARIVIKKTKQGKKAYYLHMAVDDLSVRTLQTGLPKLRDRKNGVLGIDFNVAGCAWSVVKPDGNIVKGQQGFEPWFLGDNKGANKIQIASMAKKLIEKAKKQGVAIAIENLDFSDKFARMRSDLCPAWTRKYHKMLSSLAISQFEASVLNWAQINDLMVYKINPMYSSVGGFVKFGYKTKLSSTFYKGSLVGVDMAASRWIARQALFGQTYEKRGFNKEILVYEELKDSIKTIKVKKAVKLVPVLGVKLHKEAVPAATLQMVKQSKSHTKVAYASKTDKIHTLNVNQWRAIASCVGKKRSGWSKSLTELLNPPLSLPMINQSTGLALSYREPEKKQ